MIKFDSNSEVSQIVYNTNNITIYFHCVNNYWISLWFCGSHIYYKHNASSICMYYAYSVYRVWWDIYNIYTI